MEPIGNNASGILMGSNFEYRPKIYNYNNKLYKNNKPVSTYDMLQSMSDDDYEYYIPVKYQDAFDDIEPDDVEPDDDIEQDDDDYFKFIPKKFMTVSELYQCIIDYYSGKVWYNELEKNFSTIGDNNITPYTKMINFDKNQSINVKEDEINRAINIVKTKLKIESVFVRTHKINFYQNHVLILIHVIIFLIKDILSIL